MGRGLILVAGASPSLGQCIYRIVAPSPAAPHPSIVPTCSLLAPVVDFL